MNRHVRPAAATLLAAITIPVISACHHAAPTPAPAPVQAQPATPAGPSAAELARRDSIARAEREAADRAARDAAARAAAAEARATVEQKVYFDFDKSDLRDDARATLDRKTPVLTSNASWRIRVEGNTDERGSDEYNMALGTRRAAEAKRYLTEHGIDGSRIEVISNGKEKPVCSDHDESCWSQNRRDEFVITAGNQISSR